MSFESVDFFVKDTTPAKDPVAGVVVKVFSADGVLVYGQQLTDAAGRAAFLLPSGVPYQARFYKFAVAFGPPQLFTALPAPLQPGETNTFDVKASSVAPPVPLDARLCTAYGYFRDVTGAPQAYVEIHFIAQFEPVWLEGAAVVKERVIVRTDEKGYVQLNLIRNGQYNCTLQGEEDIVRQIDVPDAPNVNIADLIFPVINRVVTVPAGPFTITKGSSLAIELHIMASDGNDLGKAVGEVYYKSSDGTVVGFSFTETGLLLQGLEVGTSEITITRADQSIVRIPDAGVLGQPLLVTVTP